MIIKLFSKNKAKQSKDLTLEKKEEKEKEKKEKGNKNYLQKQGGTGHVPETA